MANAISNIEKEYILLTAMRNDLDIEMNASGTIWITKITNIEKNKIVFKHDIPLPVQRKNILYDFKFEMQGQDILFKTSIIEPGTKEFSTAIPDTIFKNLSRKFNRLPPPDDFLLSFSFDGECYDLNFPTSKAFNPGPSAELAKEYDKKDLRELMEEFSSTALELGTERALVLFKDKKPTSFEEQITAKTGKCLYIQTAISGLPTSDPFVQSTIITKMDVEKWFSSGESKLYAESKISEYEASLRKEGIISLLIVPVIFQSYTIACLIIKNKDPNKKPFSLETVETFFSFARILSWTLKRNGYFKDAPKLDKEYLSQVIDISAGGILFACRDSKLISVLKKGALVSVQMKTKQRQISAHGTIKAHYKSENQNFFSIQFDIMAPEDFRYLYEYLYKTPYSDKTSGSLEEKRLNN